MSPEVKTVLLTLISSGFFTVLLQWILGKIDAKKGMRKTLDNIKAELEKEHDERELDSTMNLRSRILRFNDELLRGDRHSKSMFDAILIDCSKYENYCTRHNDFQNGVATESIANIRRCYRKCEEEADFL